MRSNTLVLCVAVCNDQGMTRDEALEAIAGGLKMYAGYAERGEAEQLTARRLLLIAYCEFDDRRTKGARILLHAIEHLTVPQ